MKESHNSYIIISCLSIFAFLTTLTTVSALILSSSSSHAETSSVLASVTVPDVCTIAADNSSAAHTDTVGVGEYKANIGETVFNITCNDNNGYSIYAVGYSNNTVGNTNLIGTTNGATIPTGTSTATGSNAVSNWAMKLTAVSGTFPATILDSYDSYHVVPSTATKVATRTSSIDLSEDSQIKTTYAVSISPAQTADSYVGKVKYTVVHPNYANADGSVPPLLYDSIASMSKGIQTATDIRDDITTNNSGVYEYNANFFGTASDAANTHKIYYYRGILDETVGNYGSDGDGKAWPNYVILDANEIKENTDTCWRIVRTTGSGGVKMIYNGKWTGSTCANSTTSAQVAQRAFDTTANSSGKSIVGVGYTYNANYKSTTSATAYGILFGTDTNYSGNTTNSTIKNYIENTFWPTISTYENKLEASAGYCNDRTMNTSTSWSSAISDSANVDAPYATATSGNTNYYFGAYIRNYNTDKNPTLTCPRPNADLYTTPTANNGNKQLSKPVALLTADEVLFAGSGNEVEIFVSGGIPFHPNSYLASGSNYWLISPNSRSSNGNTYTKDMNSGGPISGTLVSGNYNGIRPVISLVSGTIISGGSGTATDPWVVTP